MSKRNPGGLITNAGLRKPSVTDQSQNSGVWMLEEQFLAEAKGTWANQSGQGYEIGGSLRFRASAGAFLSRTPATTTNRQIWTWSAWVKQGNSLNSIFSTNSSDNLSYNYFGFDAGAFRLYQWNGSGYDFHFVTTPVYRDPSAWYHFVIQVDTTQAAAPDRVRFYVNGVQVTAFSTNTTPSQNLNTYVNHSSYSHLLGRNPAGSATYYDGNISEVNHIDGQALEPTAFGYFDYNGVWQPKRYIGAYGTNGFYLPMSVDAPEYNIEYFILGGGSGGSRGAAAGGGGGGGGYTSSSTTTIEAGRSMSIVVGGGGSGATSTNTNGSAGGASSITIVSTTTTTITANGGTNVTGGGTVGLAGLNGGSGGGSGANAPPGVGGTDGGNGGAGTYGAGLGQGTTTRAFGGTLYAGGGGGGGGSSYWGTQPIGAAGGAGGGASGGNDSTVGNSASANTGGGGGGGGGNQAITGTNGGAGGSGIVIIRYLGAQRATGGTVTSAGGYTIHTFTSSGTYSS